MKKKIRTALMLAAAAQLCMAKDRGFAALQRQLEAAYGIKQTRIPFMNVARLAMKTAKPFAGRAFDIAIYDDVPEHEGWPALKPPDDEWTQVVRTEEAHERTIIFARPEGNRMRIMLLTESPGEIVLVESEADPREFLRGFHSPE